MAGPKNQQLYPALLWDPAPDRGVDAVRCNLCAHRCVIKAGQLGICAVRRNLHGRLTSRVHGMATSMGVDPIEKKPLFHFHPGAGTLSIATVGCNFGCEHCQNASLSHWPRGRDAADPVPGGHTSPEEVVAMAISSDSDVISYTYSEPTVFFEYALDIATLANARGLKNVFVTNGYMTAEAVALLAPVLDAANVDLKGLDDGMLRREVGARSGPVTRTIEDLVRRGIWVEVTTLVVPGSNDDDAQLSGIARFISELDPEIPWHVSRFHPTYKRTDRPPTPRHTLHRAVELGRAAGLAHVYTGNVRGDDNESTFCPGCGERVIQRHGFALGRVCMADGRCSSCGRKVAGVGMP